MLKPLLWRSICVFVNKVLWCNWFCVHILLGSLYIIYIFFLIYEKVLIYMLDYEVLQMYTCNRNIYFIYCSNLPFIIIYSIFGLYSYLLYKIIFFFFFLFLFPFFIIKCLLRLFISISTFHLCTSVERGLYEVMVWAKLGSSKVQQILEWN